MSPTGCHFLVRRKENEPWRIVKIACLYARLRNGWNVEKALLTPEKQIKKMTNAQKIRAMSDEELAEFLVVANPTNCLDCAFSCGWRCQPDRQDYSDTEKCLEGKKRWLKQPAEE